MDRPAEVPGPVRLGEGRTSVFFRDPDRNVIGLSEPLRGAAA